MRGLSLALTVLVAASQLGLSAGLAAADIPAASPITATRHGAAAPAQFVALCAPGEAPIPDTLYFRNGAVALSGCYPLADVEELSQLEMLPPDLRVCRPAFPRADVRDDFLTSVLACALPTGVVITFEGDRSMVPEVMSALTDMVSSGVLGSH